VLRRSLAGARTARPRTDRRSAACTARVRRDDGEARGSGQSEASWARCRPGEGAWPRAARDLGQRGIERCAGANTEGAGAASRHDVAAQSVTGPFSIC
jgi:hypothetical protein